MVSIITPQIREVDNRTVKISIPVDTNTDDESLKYKIRDINLVKHNPNIFTNKGQFLDMIGGEKTIAFTSATTLIFYLYRWRANNIRKLSFREGLWMKHFFAMYGFAFGLFYSSIFFFQHQRIYNDMTANFLLKRFKGSKDLDRKHIWAIRDIPNDDECYYASSTFIKTFPH
jgi:hypothetical protein